MDISLEASVSNIKDDRLSDGKKFLSNEEFQINNNDIINRIESKIQKHCDDLRKKIDLKVESLIETLNKQRDELFNKINKFQESKIERTKKYFNEERGKQLIESFNKKLEYLVNESKKLETNTIIEMGKIYEKKELIVEDALKIGYLYFHQSTPLEVNEEKLIGYLDEINDEMSVIGKLKYIGKNEITYGVETEEIKESLVAVNENGFIAIYDDNKLLIYENNELKISKNLNESLCKGICLKDNLLAAFYDSSVQKYSIDLYDDNEFKLLKNISIGYARVLKIVMNDIKIFIITHESPFLRIFDKDLNHIESIVFPHATNVNKIFIGNEKIFFQNGNTISYLNENNGLFLKYFEIEDSFKLFSISDKTSEIITYSSKERVIRVYKIGGTIVGEFGVPHFWRVDSICVNESGKIVINDKKRKIFYSN